MFTHEAFKPSLSSPTAAIAKLPPPIIQTVIFQYLPSKLKDKIPYVSETIRMIHMRVEQDVNIETAMIRCRFNGSILLLCIWQDTRQPDRFTCIYKTINQQLIVLKVMIKNRPIIVIVNAGSVRGRQCFYVSNTYQDNPSGFSFGLQAYQKWIVPGWNPVCPDYLPASYWGKDHWQEEVEIDFIAKHVLHSGRQPRRLYPLSICFPCCLCPQICLARFGNYYPIQDRDIHIMVKKDPQITILELSNAEPDDANIDFTINGLFPNIQKEDYVPVDYFSFANHTSEFSITTDYVPPTPIYETGGVSGSAMIPNPMIDAAKANRRPSSKKIVKNQKASNVNEANSSDKNINSSNNNKAESNLVHPVSDQRTVSRSSRAGLSLTEIAL